MLQHVKYFKGLLTLLFPKGNPSFWDEYGKLISQSKYQYLLVQARLDCRKFEDMTYSLSGKVLIDKIAMDFEILDQFRMIGDKLSPISYVDHVKLRVLPKGMENLEIPSRDQWKTIYKFGKMKHRLHQ